MKRPKTTDGSLCSTEQDAVMFELLGGGHFENNAFSNSQLKFLNKFYGFYEEQNGLMRAGAFHNLMRFVQADGLRVMGELARHLEEDEDPVVFVQKLMIDAGFDVTTFSEENNDY